MKMKKLISNVYHKQKSLGRVPQCIIVKLQPSNLVHIPVTPLYSLSDKYSWKKYEPLYPPNYGLNNITAILLEYL